MVWVSLIQSQSPLESSWKRILHRTSRLNGGWFMLNNRIFNQPGMRKSSQIIMYRSQNEHVQNCYKSIVNKIKPNNNILRYIVHIWIQCLWPLCFCNDGKWMKWMFQMDGSTHVPFIFPVPTYEMPTLKKTRPDECERILHERPAGLFCVESKGMGWMDLLLRRHKQNELVVFDHPSEKICSSKLESSPIFGVNIKKYLSCHHLV